MPLSYERLVRERDLYRQCLALGSGSDPEALLAEALATVRELTLAESGLIELSDTGRGHERVWTADVGMDETQRAIVRERISRGVVAEAIETGETVHTPSALLDARFEGRESVRRSEIHAVLCVPLRAQDVVGVVYLQNRIGGGPFAEEDIECVETIAKFVSEVGARTLELQRQRGLADATAEFRSKLRLDGVIGRAPALAKLLARLGAVATMDGNVLLTGPSGTGKSLFARVLHDNSPRADGPFVALNCAAIPEALVESELFGAERGAHSAVGLRGTAGKVASAEGGTLFLDEIGELPPTVQAKVLDLLQHKTYHRLGATEPTRADIRIVTATNRDLPEAVADRAFREDLYFRIRSLQLVVPALHQRRQDIPLLAEHFCREACERNGLDPLPPSPAALAALGHEDWPGNVRELASRCEEAVVSARVEGTPTVEMQHFFPEAVSPSAAEQTFQSARAAWERTFLRSTLHAQDWNVAQTARDLDISRSHLNTLIKRFGLQRDPR